MWIGRKEFEELKRKVEKLTERNSSVESEVFDVVSAPLFFIDNCGKKHRDGDVFTTIPLVSKLKIQVNLLLKELGYEYKPETETKEPAKLVKIGNNPNKAKK
jgi:hypothetical protein